MAQIVGVVSGKGGVGKTTLVSNLGVILSQKFNKRVVLVDCNITTSHLGLHLGMYYSPITLNSVLRKEAKLEEAIYEHSTGVNVIPASLTFKNLEGADMFRLKRIIKPLHKKVDYIILDGSPGLGRETMAVLKSSNQILFVTTPYFTSILDVVRCREAIDALGIKADVLGVVLNMVRNERNEIGKSEVEGFTGLKVLASIPFDRSVYQSLSLGAPVFLLKPYSKASREMVRLASLICGEPYEITLFEKFLNILRI